MNNNSPTKIIEETYEKIYNNLREDENDRPQVYHTAIVDEWKLKLFSSNDGAQVYATNTINKKIIGFRRISKHSWIPITISSERSDLILIANLFKKAIWVDFFNRK